jgi:signal transduction histidine kinase
VNSFRPLLAMVNAETDPARALEGLTRAALELTRSRNALIALLDEEAGLLEIAYGSGPEWSEQHNEARIALTTREGIVAYVGATGQPFITGDVENEPRYVKMFATTRSEMAVPIRDTHGRARGVFNVESDGADAYNEDTLDLLHSLAECASVVVNRADATIREEALVEIGHALDRAQSEDEAVRGVIRIAGEVLRFQAFSVFLLDPARDEFVLRGSVGRLKDQVGKLGYRRGEGLTGWVAETGQAVLTHDPRQDPRWRGKNVEFPDEEIASFVAVPVVFRGRCLGVLRVLRKVSENRHLDNRFTGADVRVLTAIAEQFASTLENVRSLSRLLRSERMAAWGELSAKSSHMIGNRVFALKGDVNELGHVLKLPDLPREPIESLHRSLEVNVLRIEEILHEFRDFLTATLLSPEPVDLNELVETTTQEIFPRRTPVRLSLVLGDSLPQIVVDSKKLRRALSELIENSMNYVQEGELRVQTAVATPDAIKKGRVPPGGMYVMIEVADTGPGVEDDKKATIFQPFYSGRVKGMGLGLSIVKGIVDAHGGTVYEDGEHGRGAKFVILLPVANRPLEEKS